MMRNKKVFVWLLLVGLCVSLGWWLEKRDQVLSPVAPPPSIVTASEPVLHEEPEVETVKPEGKPSLPKKVLIAEVPFTVQAPDGEWANPLFQDGCEEAASIMAAAWVEGESVLTSDAVKKTITSLAAFEKKRFGQAVDTSAKDTATLLQEYFKVTTVEWHSGVTLEMIRETLVEGHIVIVPTDGRKLKNPNFKSPGPTHHMLVIIGYDTDTHELIVNDPGTRNGKGYRYPEEVLLDAILDYATGDHVPVTSADKVMLSVWRSKADALQK